MIGRPNHFVLAAPGSTYLEAIHKLLQYSCSHCDEAPGYHTVAPEIFVSRYTAFNIRHFSANPEGGFDITLGFAL